MADGIIINRLVNPMIASIDQAMLTWKVVLETINGRAIGFEATLWTSKVF
jgi:hypothetical protein